MWLRRAQISILLATAAGCMLLLILHHNAQQQSPPPWRIKELMRGSPQSSQRSKVTDLKTCLAECGKGWSPAKFSNYVYDPKSMVSTCSSEVTDLGPGQKVLSFNFYYRNKLDVSSSYFQGIAINAELVQRLYPGWRMRVYHNVSNLENTTALCDLQCRYPELLDLCYVGNLPHFGNILGSQPNMWRFLAMADPLVHLMMSRDLDSSITLREVAAVRAWVDSGAVLHVMRDHPYHRTSILAGMWGARVSAERIVLGQALGEMLWAGLNEAAKGADQSLLTAHLWSIARPPGFLLQHDSYFCGNADYTDRGLMCPFPTPRLQNSPLNFVGARRGLDDRPMLRECPPLCRGNENWTYC